MRPIRDAYLDRAGATVAPRPSWTPLDAGNALREAERACRGIHGPTLMRTLDGWEASATIREGRRFGRQLRTVNADPSIALNELADMVRIARYEQ